MNGIGRRTGNLLGFAACAAMLLWAIFWAQGALHLEPCPLCIFQRIGVAAIGLVFLLAALHGPGPGGDRVYSLLLLLAVLATAAVSVRHLWIQAQPEGSVPACGATLDYLLDVFPLTDVIRKVLTGSGECAKVTWRLLGLSMPAWVLIATLALAVWGFAVNLTRFGRR